MRKSAHTEFIGQAVDYSAENMVDVRKLKLDELNFPRVDFIKLDVEGMELEALEGARQLIETSHPILLVESIKSDKGQLAGMDGDARL